MPSINLENANYRLFTDFASNARSVNNRAFLSTTNTANGEVRTIRASSNWDFIGNIGRSADKARVNNDVRTLFRETIADMFGGDDHIPPDVREAMKMEDYGRGKPLTARRISLVKAAVEQAAARFSDNVAALRANATATDFLATIKDFNEDKRNDLNHIVELMLENIGNDMGLLEVLKHPQVLRKILLNSDKELRSENQILAKVAELKANVDELCSAAGGNRYILEAGLRSIAFLAQKGKAYGQGMLRTIVELSQNADLRAVAKMSARSSMLQIHRGLMQFTNAVDEIKFSSKLLHIFTDGLQAEEMLQARRAIGYILFGCLNPSIWRSVRRALSSRSAGKMISIYGDIVYGDGVFPNDIDEAEQEEMKDLAQIYNRSISLMGNILSDTTGEDFATAEEIDAQMTNSLKNSLVQDLRSFATVSLARKKQAIVSQYLNGNGQGADVVSAAILTQTNGAILGNVEANIAEDMNNNVRMMLNYHIVTSCKQIANNGPEKSQFALLLPKIASGNVRIKLGKELLAGDFETAMNQIARFVAGNDKATYKGLEKPAQTKAHIIMSLLTHEASNAAFDGSAMAFCDDLNKVPFNAIGDENQEKRNFDISFDDKGNLVVKHEYEKPIRSILPEGAVPQPADLQRSTEGRNIKTSYTYNLKGYLFDHICQLDFGEVDTSYAKEIFDSDTPKKMKNTIKKLPSEFVFLNDSAPCHVKFSAELN